MVVYTMIAAVIGQSQQTIEKNIGLLQMQKWYYMAE